MLPDLGWMALLVKLTLRPHAQIPVGKGRGLGVAQQSVHAS